MAQYKQTKQAIIPAPATATQAVCEATEASFVKHFTTILTPTLMIAHRKGCYATVINGTSNGQSLETLVGTTNAKLLTENVLNAVSARYSAVPV